MVHRYPNREYFFLNTKGKKITSSSALATIQEKLEEAFTDTQTGILVNSGFLTGLSVADAKKKVIDYLEESKIGSKKVNFKLRDWVFSRQRYWGEPIPMVYCEDCGWVPLDEKDLPLKLPEVKDFLPGENGESPLAKHEEWINTTTLALKGVSKLIQKGLTLSEIKYLTGFETKKIEDVSRWLMNQEDVESVINNKLNLIDI